jgi:drug/metabolite transporter (DMT)-like permease
VNRGRAQGLGVALLLAAMTVVPFVDAVAKHLSDGQSPFFVSFSRYFAAGCVALAIAAFLRRPIALPRKDWRGQLGRTALLMGAMTLLITALSQIPMADALGAFFISPVVSTILAIVVLKEEASIPRVGGAALGFGGAILIVRPEGSMETGALLALGAGFLFGCYLTATRRAADTGDDLSTLAIQCLLGSAMLAPFAFWGGAPLIDWSAVLQIAAMGALSATCHFLTIFAFRFADATTLSPFMYFNMLTAGVVGYVLFGETPTPETLTGMAVIAAGGMMIALQGSARFNRGADAAARFIDARRKKAPLGPA